jgi:hypothetical protein
VSWFSILLLLLRYLPELISLIRDLSKRKDAIPPLAADALRLELAAVLSSPLPRQEKRRRLKEILLRESLADLKNR